MKSILFIPCKNPANAPVKTRLAAGTSPEFAEKTYRQTLACLATEHANREYDLVFVLPSGHQVFPEIRHTKIMQVEARDLAGVLASAFNTLTQNYDATIVAASDCAASYENVQECLKQLSTHNFAIAPSLDGGYSLLGMRSFRDIFSSITMSTCNVCEDTIKLLGKEVQILSPITDYDEVTDIPYFWSCLPITGNFAALREQMAPYNRRVSISVVTATFHRPQDTLELAESVQRSYDNFLASRLSSDLNFEMLICDGSYDSRTEDIFRTKQFPFVSYYRVQSKGLTFVRDFGIQKAIGKYIHIVDSDCIVSDDWILKTYYCLKKNHFPTCIQGNYYLAYNEGWVAESEARLDEIRFREVQQVDTRNFVISKDAYTAIGGFDTKHYYAAAAEDLVLKQRIKDAKLSLIFDDEVRVFHKYPCSVRGNLRRFAYYGRGAIHVGHYYPELLKTEFNPYSLWRNLLTARFGKTGVREYLYQALKLLVFTVNYFWGIRIYKKEMYAQKQCEK